MNKSLAATQRNFDRAERPRASMAPALRTLLALFVVCSGGCSFASLQSGVDADDAGLDTALVRGAAITHQRRPCPHPTGGAPPANPLACCRPHFVLFFTRPCSTEAAFYLK